MSLTCHVCIPFSVFLEKIPEAAAFLKVYQSGVEDDEEDLLPNWDGSSTHGMDEDPRSESEDDEYEEDDNAAEEREIVSAHELRRELLEKAEEVSPLVDIDAIVSGVYSSCRPQLKKTTAFDPDNIDWADEAIEGNDLDLDDEVVQVNTIPASSKLVSKVSRGDEEVNNSPSELYLVYLHSLTFALKWGALSRYRDSNSLARSGTDSQVTSFMRASNNASVSNGRNSTVTGHTKQPPKKSLVEAAGSRPSNAKKGKPPMRTKESINSAVSLLTTRGQNSFQL